MRAIRPCTVITDDDDDDNDDGDNNNNNNILYVQQCVLQKFVEHNWFAHASVATCYYDYMMLYGYPGISADESHHGSIPFHTHTQSHTYIISLELLYVKIIAAIRFI